MWLSKVIAVFKGGFEAIYPLHHSGVVPPDRPASAPPSVKSLCSTILKVTLYRQNETLVKRRKGTFSLANLISHNV
jgi:hypothetical protein